MGYTARSRDRFLRLVSALTGVAAFATVAGAGVATGLAARQTGLRDQERSQEQARREQARRAAAAAAQPPRVSWVTKKRPTRTVVHTRVVHRVSGSGVSSVGPGGAVSSYSGGTTSGPSGGGSAGAVAPPLAPAPAPAPVPAPAPTSGS